MDFFSKSGRFQMFVVTARATERPGSARNDPSSFQRDDLCTVLAGCGPLRGPINPLAGQPVDWPCSAQPIEKVS